MFSEISSGLTYLSSQSALSLLALFWFVIIFELPRYTLLFFSAAFFSLRYEAERDDLTALGKVTVLIAGHNEEHAIDICVRAVREQSLPPDEIVVVSDGSSDGMRGKMAAMLREGLIQKAYSCDLRGGKSAGINLASRYADGDIVINIDCDCSFDRHAIKNILTPFTDLEVGAVSGNILPRNVEAGLIPTFQAIEHLTSISLGKQAAALFGQVTCVSGAFGAFRRIALDSVGGLDAGGGEDLDVTMRLRRAGWKTYFAADALCYTDVPATLIALTKQRFRWERDAVRLRYRKHIDLMNPFSPRFKLSELIHEIEFLFFNIIGAAVFPFYILWLFTSYGQAAIFILLGAQAALAVLDMLIFLLAAKATPKADAVKLAPYVIGYSLFNGVLMRTIRLAAYIQEWVFSSSSYDAYVPDKVHCERRL